MNRTYIRGFSVKYDAKGFELEAGAPEEVRVEAEKLYGVAKPPAVIIPPAPTPSPPRGQTAAEFEAAELAELEKLTRPDPAPAVPPVEAPPAPVTVEIPAVVVPPADPVVESAPAVAPVAPSTPEA